MILTKEGFNIRPLLLRKSLNKEIRTKLVKWLKWDTALHGVDVR